jgi:hypothetical protein
VAGVVLAAVRVVAAAQHGRRGGARWQQASCSDHRILSRMSQWVRVRWGREGGETGRRRRVEPGLIFLARSFTRGSIVVMYFQLQFHPGIGGVHN